MLRKNDIADWLMGLQDRICASLEGLDGTDHFHEDAWQREGGGGGRTRIIQGKHIEKGGVNFSAVEGELSPNLQKALGVADSSFFATGVSIVLHPSNPMVPIIHMNVRYFETGPDSWWFGGGIDVTPHYVFAEDARGFHQLLKAVCDQHHQDYYQEFKKWADDYFYIKHRKETRGIGGIFFDKLDASRGSKEDLFAFLKDVGEAFVPAYTALFSKHYQEAFTEAHREWQLLRRGRYVEFNLVWDRGTKFGLDTDGRIESILMSLPRDVRWYYDHRPEESSPEAETLRHLVKGIDWLHN
ncbi:MAG: oxygen-dependent coproporphyrinogen oxidase [Saprospiraceae bacterium]|nr:oxygen-dependent coproporphyrinogen oxidase [Saprospiraceae bacterium]